jgi:hypothetical protein
MLDNQDNLHVYPESAQSVAVAMATTSFIFTADPDTGLLVGYSLALSSEQVSITIDSLDMCCMCVICINNIKWKNNEVVSFQLQVSVSQIRVDFVKFVKVGYRILQLF